MTLPYRTRISAKALIFHQGKILLVRERVVRNGQAQVIYDFPGGGLEDQEVLREAAVREVWEEVHLKIIVGQPVGGWDFVVDTKDETIHQVCVGFYCTLAEAETQVDLSFNPADEDIFEATWLSPAEVWALENPFINDDMKAAFAAAAAL